MILVGSTTIGGNITTAGIQVAGVTSVSQIGNNTPGTPITMTFSGTPNYALIMDSGLQINEGSGFGLDLEGFTTATSATAGSATALPSVPLGYVEITINGTVVKLPYYAV